MWNEKQLSLIEPTQNVKTCAFTGHRNLDADFSKSALKKQVEKMIKKGVDTFLCGMAVGFDMLAAETVLALKKKYPNVKLIACIPCYGQERFFSEEDKKRYAVLVQNADEKTVLAERYYKGCMQKRDIYMADRADTMLAYCKRETGGAAFTVRYFQRKYPNKEIVFL
ncbi:MAG: DUF1273 family protein [Clostridia bacterium]|nr:DUF1273 family protein [Clostridia bacterium]